MTQKETEATSEEKALIDARLEEAERNPDSWIPWEQVKAKLQQED